MGGVCVQIYMYTYKHHIFFIHSVLGHLGCILILATARTCCKEHENTSISMRLLFYVGVLEF